MDKVASKRYIVFLILALAIVIRIIGLDKSFQGDEFFSLMDARNFNSIPEALIADTHPPLYFYLLNMWMTIYTSEAFLRLLSVIFGAGSCLLLYFIGRDTINTHAGTMAALLMALAPIAVWSSQYIRTYSMANFLLILSVYFLVRIFKEDGKRTLDWAGYILASIAAIYTFYFSALIILAESVFVFLFLRKEKALVTKWALSQAAIACSYLPWIPFFIYQRSSYVGHPQEAGRVGFYIGSLHIGAIIKSGLGMIGLDPRFMAKDALSQIAGLKYAALGAIAAALALILLFAIRQTGSLRPDRKEDRHLYLFLILSTGSFAIALVINQAFKIILMSHYFIASFALLILFVLGLLEKGGGRWWKTALLTGLVSLYLCRLVFLYQDKEMDFRSAHDHVKSILLTTDAAIVAPSFGGIFDYYFFDMPKKHYLEDARTLRLADEYIIFVSYPTKLELKERDRRFRTFLASKRYRMIGSKGFGDLVVERYTRR